MPRPGCTQPAGVVDIDHVRERRDGGPTSAANCQCLCRAHHSTKTRRHWRAEIDAEGVVMWRLPDGTTLSTYPLDYRDLGTETLADADADAVPVDGAGVGEAAVAAVDGSNAAGLGGSCGDGGTEVTTQAHRCSELEESGDPRGSAGARHPGAASASAATHRADADETDPVRDWHRGAQRQRREEERRLREQLESARSELEHARHDLESYRREHPPF